MVSAEDIRNAVLLMAQRQGGKGEISAQDVARFLRPNQWQEILDQVRLVIESLVHEGKLKSSRSGDTVRVTKN